MDIMKFIDRLDKRAEYASESATCAFQRRDFTECASIDGEVKAIREIIINLLEELEKEQDKK